MTALLYHLSCPGIADRLIRLDGDLLITLCLHVLFLILIIGLERSGVSDGKYFRNGLLQMAKTSLGQLGQAKKLGKSFN